jgi:hypothetical protein
MEYHDFNLFTAGGGTVRTFKFIHPAAELPRRRRGRVCDLCMETLYRRHLCFFLSLQGHRVVLKPLRLGDFFVEHLSGFEHNFEKLVRPDILDGRAARAKHVHSVAANIAAQKCAPWAKNDNGSHIGASSRNTTAAQQKRAAWEPAVASLVLIPYYGGPPEAFGNAHSTSPRATKLLQTKGAICAAAALFRRVKVGVCTDGPGAVSDADDIRSLDFPFVELVAVRCGHGVRLPFVFLREAQVRMVRARALRRDASSLPHASTSAASWDVDVVFFTEADQVFST